MPKATPIAHQRNHQSQTTSHARRGQLKLNANRKRERKANTKRPHAKAKANAQTQTQTQALRSGSGSESRAESTAAAEAQARARANSNAPQATAKHTGQPSTCHAKASQRPKQTGVSMLCLGAALVSAIHIVLVASNHVYICATNF